MTTSPAGLRALNRARMLLQQAVDQLTVASSESHPPAAAAQLANLGHIVAQVEALATLVEADQLELEAAAARTAIQAAVASKTSPGPRRCAIPGCNEPAFVHRCVTHVLAGEPSPIPSNTPADEPPPPLIACPRCGSTATVKPAAVTAKSWTCTECGGLFRRVERAEVRHG